MAQCQCYDVGSCCQAKYPEDSTCTNNLGQNVSYIHSTISRWVTWDGGRSSGIEDTADVSYSDLFYYQYHQYPTPSELDTISTATAMSWDSSMLTNDMPAGFPTGVVHDSVVGGSKTQWTWPSQPICYRKVPDCNADMDRRSYTGYLQFPDGTKCPLLDVLDDDQGIVDWCHNTKIQVKIRPGCSECN